ncbi:MAG: DUF4179 domain-containing protein [Coriobacteriales bacterium]|jgi:hypothetical protein
MRQACGSRRSRASGRRPRFAAAAACLAVVVGLGGYAYASGQLVGITNAIGDVFSGAPAPTEISDKVGHPVNASATSDGVTISADAVMGDDHGYAVVYSVSRDDGEPFGQVGTNANGTLTIDGRPVDVNLDQTVDGATGQGGGLYLYDADPTDNAIQVVTKYTTDTSLIGATVSAHFTGLGLFGDDYASVEPLATGTWDLKFTLNYESDQVPLTPAGTLSIEGTDGTVQSVSVSPVGIWVEYTMDGVEEAPASDGMWSPAFLDLGTITVTMYDGSSISVPCGAGEETEQDGTTVCKSGSFFDRVIDPAQVASVSFNGVTAVA